MDNQGSSSDCCTNHFGPGWQLLMGQYGNACMYGDCPCHNPSTGEIADFSYSEGTSGCLEGDPNTYGWGPSQ